MRARRRKHGRLYARRLGELWQLVHLGLFLRGRGALLPRDHGGRSIDDRYVPALMQRRFPTVVLDDRGVRRRGAVLRADVRGRRRGRLLFHAPGVRYGSRLYGVSVVKYPKELDGRLRRP